MKSLKLHLKRFAIFYILWGIIASFAIVWEFKLLTRAKENEKVDLFVCANVIEQGNFNHYLNENKPDYLKEVNANYVDNNNFVFSQNLSTYGSEVADIYLMSKDKFELVTGKDYYFYELDATLTKQIFGDEIELFSSDEKNYAFKIQSEYFENDDLYLGFSKYTEHIKSYNGIGTDGAVDIAKKLLGK